MRDYKKQYEWEKGRYKHLSICITKEEYEELKKILQKDNKTITSWLREKIKSKE